MKSLDCLSCPSEFCTIQICWPSVPNDKLHWRRHNTRGFNPIGCSAFANQSVRRETAVREKANSNIPVEQHITAVWWRKSNDGSWSSNPQFWVRRRWPVGFREAWLTYTNTLMGMESYFFSARHRHNICPSWLSILTVCSTFTFVSPDSASWRITSL